MARDNEKLYSTAEIMMATGVGRGTVTSRAMRLGYKRDGRGYTVDQVLAIITAPLESHRKSEAAAMELREKLNERLEEENIPIAIVGNKKGEFELEYRK